MRSRRICGDEWTCSRWLWTALVFFLIPPATHAQESAPPIDPPGDSAAAANAFTKPAAAREPVESNLVFEGLASYGNYRIFASGWDSKLYTGGVEYDRHSWGRFLGARMDYVAEFLPVVILNEPANADIWGNVGGSHGRKMLYGVGFSPIGFRWLWRDGGIVKPYVLAKGGLLVFDKKAISNEGAYEQFTLQSQTGLLVRATPRIDVRLGLFGDFHFSNGFVVPVNPGLDVMNSSIGISYRLGGPAGAR